MGQEHQDCGGPQAEMGPDPAKAPPANGCWGSAAPIACRAARSHGAGPCPQRHLQVEKGLAVAVPLAPLVSLCGLGAVLQPNTDI